MALRLNQLCLDSPEDILYLYYQILVNTNHEERGTGESLKFKLKNKRKRKKKGIHLPCNSWRGKNKFLGLILRTRRKEASEIFILG